jgi:hypothetical protein
MALRTKGADISGALRHELIPGWKDRAVHTPILGELSSDNWCRIGTVTATGKTPVLAACRALLAQGVNPDTAVEIYRGATLALRVRSIGEAAALEMNSKGTGFVPQAVRRASPSAFPENSEHVVMDAAP